MCTRHYLLLIRQFSSCYSQRSSTVLHKHLAFSRPDLNFDFLEDGAEMRKMEENARIRGFANEFQQLKETWNRIMESSRISNEDIDNAGKKLKEKEYKELWDQVHTSSLV